MNRLEKELRKAGIVFEADEYMVMRGAEYDTDARLFGLYGDFILILRTSAVLDPMFGIYDSRTFKFIGEQKCYPEHESFFGEKCYDRWWSWANV